jgi:hypothetical protein
LSSSPFGVIVATITAVVLVAPATVALAAFVVTLAVVATTFFAVEVALVVDCCVPSPPEEDNRLPSPSGKVPPWPSSPLALFVTLALFIALVFVVVTALIVAIAFADLL